MQTSNTVIVDGALCRRIGGKLLMSYSTAARYSGYARGTICNQVSAGLLRSYRLGRLGHVDKDELDRRLLGDVAH